MLPLTPHALDWIFSGTLALSQTPETMALLSEHRPAVQALVVRVLRRPPYDADVEDCVHEALRRALENQHRLRPGHGLRPWLLGIARHVALDALRAQGRQRARGAEVGGTDEAVQAVEQLVHPGPGPEALVARKQGAARLHRALATLPERQREALLMFHVEGLGYREIAERLSVPLGTVGTWVLRARQGLAQSLADAARGAVEQEDKP